MTLKSKQAGPNAPMLADMVVLPAQARRSVLFTKTNVAAAIEEVLSSFEDVWLSCPDEQQLQIAGEKFCVRSPLPEYLEQASRALADRPEGADANGAAPVRIAVVTMDHPGLVVPHWPIDTFEDRRAELSIANTPLRYHYYPQAGFWQVFDRQRRIGLQIMDGPDGCPPWDSGSPLRNFVQWALGASDRSLLHGGTLSDGQKGMLLVGEGGSGKSSTVLAGIFGGLHSVGDDYVLVDADRMEAAPVLDTLKQDDAGLTRLGQSDHPAIPKTPNWQGKRQFYLPEITDQPLPHKLHLDALVLPVIAGEGHSRFEPMPTKEAFLALAPSGVTQIHCDRARLFSVAARVSRALPAFRLHLGTDPAEITSAIRSFLKGL